MTPPEDDGIAPPARGHDGTPDPADPLLEAEDERELRSLREDVEALIEDGRTYLETELVYQKSRAAFVADRAKGALIYGAIAALLGFLALIGLTVGLIIALTPYLTAWGASALVVALLLLFAWLAVRGAGKRWASLMWAIDGGSERQP